MEWIKCSEQMPPKEGKFLFDYHCGIGLASWGMTYKFRNGCSQRDTEKYLLILWPCEIVDGVEPFEWDEAKMIEMEVSWMPLPEPPKLMQRHITIASEKLRNEIDDAYKNGYQPPLIYRPESEPPK